ncbi:MAG: bifunctional phosphopantothenoylcysteine decarboxylase/phosphopantothenate--cysteine ligase CoaBC [Dehalococcoidaceae bacterium]|nr:bifunctional phosphopantothenoylcysteine decarboxylase/phosphopantothenate--cysteine ligase CoaBC [Dehalococcoidaceae bacterium]
MLEGKEVILGITGSIAAYKGADIASRLSQAGARVTAVLTQSAMRFISPITFESITGNEAFTSLWHEKTGTNHITLAEKADIVLIAPATANTIAKLAGGLADDMLSCLVLATRAPVIIAPAMHTAMFENPATQGNIELLKQRGFIFIEPGEGRLASGGYGRGRLRDTDFITGTVKWIAARSGELAGKKIVVTAGGTREPLDPVRFVGNYSSGKTGHALAETARDMGAVVELVTTAEPPGEAAGINTTKVSTAEQMYAALRTALDGADCLIMAAAVADYRPQKPSGQKIKKTPGSFILDMVPNRDILDELRGNFIRIGFAAETENVESNAFAKLEAKQLDMIVANDVSGTTTGFGSDFNQASLIYPNGSTEKLPVMAKTELAEVILNAVKNLIDSRR